MPDTFFIQLRFTLRKASLFVMLAAYLPIANLVLAEFKLALDCILFPVGESNGDDGADGNVAVNSSAVTTSSSTGSNSTTVTSVCDDVVGGRAYIGMRGGVASALGFAYLVVLPFFLLLKVRARVREERRTRQNLREEHRPQHKSSNTLRRRPSVFWHCFFSKSTSPTYKVACTDDDSDRNPTNLASDSKSVHHLSYGRSLQEEDFGGKPGRTHIEVGMEVEVSACLPVVFSRSSDSKAKPLEEVLNELTKLRNSWPDEPYSCRADDQQAKKIINRSNTTGSRSSDRFFSAMIVQVDATQKLHTYNAEVSINDTSKLLIEQLQSSQVFAKSVSGREKLGFVKTRSDARYQEHRAERLARVRRREDLRRHVRPITRSTKTPILLAFHVLIERILGVKRWDKFLAWLHAKTSIGRVSKYLDGGKFDLAKEEARLVEQMDVAGERRKRWHARAAFMAPYLTRSKEADLAKEEAILHQIRVAGERRKRWHARATFVAPRSKEADSAKSSRMTQFKTLLRDFVVFSYGCKVIAESYQIRIEFLQSLQDLIFLKNDLFNKARAQAWPEVIRSLRDGEYIANKFVKQDFAAGRALILLSGMRLGDAREWSNEYQTSLSVADYALLLGCKRETGSPPVSLSRTFRHRLRRTNAKNQNLHGNAACQNSVTGNGVSRQAFRQSENAIDTAIAEDDVRLVLTTLVNDWGVSLTLDLRETPERNNDAQNKDARQKLQDAQDSIPPNIKAFALAELEVSMHVCCT